MGKTHDDDEIEIDLTELFYALKKRVVMILSALLVCAVIAGAYTKLLVTPIYSSTSTMLVLTKETTLSSLADLQIGSQLTNDYSVLINSRTVLQTVIEDLNLDMTYKELRNNVTINNLSDTRILEITVNDPDPEMAKKIVDTLCKDAATFIGEQMEVNEPKIIEQGEVPTKKTSPSTTKNILIGALIGLVLSAGFVVVTTIMDDTIKTEDDIERYLGLTTLASVPDRKDFISDKNGKKVASKKKKKKKRRR